MRTLQPGAPPPVPSPVSHRNGATPVSGDRSARIGAVLGVVAVVLGLLAGRRVDSSAVDGYGIVGALPGLYRVAVVVGAVASVALLDAAVRGHRRLAGWVVGIWLVLAHTAPALAHAHARFSIVYIHLGFIRVIDSTGTGDILIDARFAWPGFFSAFVPSLASMRADTLDDLMRLWPTLATGAGAVLVAALARRAYPTVSLIGPVSALVFVLLSWTGQDYFSPQSVGFLLHLSIILLIEAGPLRPRASLAAALGPLDRFVTGGGDRPEATSVPSSVTLLVLAGAAVVSHPLAPFFICCGLVVLGCYGRVAAWRLAAVVAVTYVVWVLIAAEPWWSTRIEELTGQMGSVAANFQSSTSDRVAGSSPSHHLVTRVRSAIGLATFASTLVVGSVMATDRFRALRPALPLAPLAGVPVLAAVVQSYGGEIIIRVLLFTLPMASILLARVVLTLPGRLLTPVLPTLAVGLLPGFLLARFGNESFEMTTAADWDATVAAYDNAGADTVIYADNGFHPGGDRDRDRIPHLYTDAEPTPEWVDSLRAGASALGRSEILVVLTPSQSAWREHVESAQAGSLDEVGAWLADQPSVTVVHHGDGAWVLSLPA